MYISLHVLYMRFIFQKFPLTSHEQMDKHGRVKVGDFGLSRRYNLKSMCRMDSTVGSDGFMAPEILLQKPYDEKVVPSTLFIRILYLLFSLGNERALYHFVSPLFVHYSNSLC